MYKTLEELPEDIRKVIEEELAKDSKKTLNDVLKTMGMEINPTTGVIDFLSTWDNDELKALQDSIRERNKPQKKSPGQPLHRTTKKRQP